MRAEPYSISALYKIKLVFLNEETKALTMSKPFPKVMADDSVKIMLCFISMSRSIPLAYSLRTLGLESVSVLILMYYIF